MLSGVIGFLFGMSVSFSILLSHFVAMKFGRGLWADALIRIGIFGVLVIGGGEAVGFFLKIIVQQDLVYFWLFTALGFVSVPIGFQVVERIKRTKH